MKKRTLTVIVLLAILGGFLFLTAVGIFNNQKKYQNMADVFELNEALPPSPLPGKGTKNDPYRIDSVEALCQFRDHVNAGYSYQFEYVLQTADLDLSAIDNWEPIGLFQSEAYFLGYYDGDSHSISHLQINRPTENVGLFGQLGGTVVNLGIESGTIIGSCIGSVAGHSYGSEAKIINCYNKASLYGYRAGGIADNFAGGTIYNCINIGKIQATEVGGIAAYSGTVIDSFSPNQEPVSSVFGGILGQSCREYAASFDEKKVENLLNKRLDSLSVNQLNGKSLYRWQLGDSDVSFAEKDINFFPLRFSLIALLLFALLLILNIWYLSRLGKRLPSADTDITSSYSFRGYWQTKGRLCAAVLREDPVFYVVVALIQAAWCLIAAGLLAGNSHLLFGFSFNNGKDIFMDFFNPLSTMNKGSFWFSHLYEADTYPPFANLIFYVLSQLIPGKGSAGGTELRTSLGGMIYLVFAFFCLFGTYHLCRKKLTAKPYAAFLACTLALCSPILFIIERGNIILLAIVAGGGFLFGYRSKSRVVREISLVCLAIAAAIKIYPAVLGGILLWEKRYKETVRCAIYGILLFFLPFFLFGGWEGFTGFLQNLTAFVDGNTAAPRDHLMNYANILSNLTQLFFDNAEVGRQIANLTLLPLSLALIGFGVFACRKRWKCLLMLTLVLTLFPNANGYYAMSFYLFPLVFFLLEEHHSIFDYFYAVFLTVCILPLQFLMGLFGINFGTLMQLYAMAQVVLLFGFATEAILLLIQRYRAKKKPAPISA